MEIDTPGNGVPIYVDSRKGRPFDLSVVTPTKYSVSALAGGPRGGKTYEMAGRKAKGGKKKYDTSTSRLTSKVKSKVKVYTKVYPSGPPSSLY